MQLEALLRSFNSNRILILDEAHRLLPGDTRRDINPVKLEIIRYIHDKTKCGVGLIATQRFDDTLKKLKYQFEQVLGRVGLPVRLYRHIENADVLPILQQYFPKPTATLQNAAFALVNDEAGGRLRTLGKLLEVASKIASASKRGMLEDDFFKSLALRKQAMGEIQHAAK
jgi:DNA transposition AAA+ family ATPase